MSHKQLACFGIILLGLNPFSYIANDVRFILSLGVLLFFGNKIKSIINTQDQWSLTSISAKFYASKHISVVYVIFAALFIHTFLCGVISIASLLESGSWKLVDLMATSFRQLLSLLFSFLEIVAGYFLAVHISQALLRKVIYGGLMLMSAVCVSQYFAYFWGFPTIGGYVTDPVVGLRPSGLAVEPKFLSVYMAVLAVLLWDDLKNDRNEKLIRILAIIFCGIIFLATSSGNGFVGLVLLMVVRLSLLRAWKAFVVIGVVLASTYAFLDLYSVENLGLRSSHLDILQNLSELDLFMFDDLMFLPLLAWKDNLFSLWLGFGSGFLHYFAKVYIANATWVSDETYIKGNISAINFISQFGLAVFLFMFFTIFSKARRLIRAKNQFQYRALDLFFLNSFVLGALISANVSIPFYVSIGWILCRAATVSHLERENISDANQHSSSGLPNNSIESLDAQMPKGTSTR